jgi:2-methylcitrate dehydratase PrpD
VDLQAAQMCLPFSVALASNVALSVDRTPALAVSDYEAGLTDASLFELEIRTTIEADDEVEAMSNERATAARVGVQLRDGRTFSMLVPAPKGSPSRPFSAQEHEARFKEELSRRISHQHCADIIAITKDLDRLDPSRLCEMLCGR